VSKYSLINVQFNLYVSRFMMNLRRSNSAGAFQIESLEEFKQCLFRERVRAAPDVTKTVRGLSN